MARAKAVLESVPDDARRAAPAKRSGKNSACRVAASRCTSAATSRRSARSTCGRC